MKKIILVAVIAISSFVGVNAQTSFGAKAGLNVANLSGDITDNKALIGFNVGVFAEITLADSFFLQPELVYSGQGTDTDVPLFGFDFFGVTESYNLNYINIPIMFKYDVANRFYLEAGPQIGFLVSAEYAGVDIKDDFETTDFGANFGLSYGFTEKLFGQARYKIGLSNIAKDSGGDKISNTVLSFSLGYKF